jgi:hypothetical protein
VVDDPRKAKTLAEACSNGDGTYDGLRALSWLSEVLNPGKGFSVDEVKEIHDQVQRRHQIDAITPQAGKDLI